MMIEVTRYVTKDHGDSQGLYAKIPYPKKSGRFSMLIRVSDSSSIATKYIPIHNGEVCAWHGIEHFTRPEGIVRVTPL